MSLVREPLLSKSNGTHSSCYYNVKGVFWAFAGFAAFSVGTYLIIQFDVIPSLELAQNLREEGSGQWLGMVENYSNIFNGSIVIQDLPPHPYGNSTRNYTVYDPYMMSCNSGYADNLSYALKTNNPAPYTSSLVSRLANEPDGRLAKFTDTCDKATSLVVRPITVGGLGGALVTAVCTLGMFSRCYKNCNKRIELEEKEEEKERMDKRMGQSTV